MNKSKLQKISDLEKWHEVNDPWNYNNNKHDLIRRNIFFDELPKKNFKNVLDIGCGQGFITKQIIADYVTGIDISKNAISNATINYEGKVVFKTGSIFDIDKLFDRKFDLVIITGVLYEQYIGDSINLIYLLIDEILERNGHLVCVHIKEWNISRFPYLKLKEIIYPYREYNHLMEIYSK